MLRGHQEVPDADIAAGGTADHLHRTERVQVDAGAAALTV